MKSAAAILRSDLPLGKDGSSRFLPWIVGAMVYLAALTLAGVLAAGELVSGWRAELTGALTIELPQPVEATDADRQARLQRVLDVLTATPGIAHAEVLGPDAMAELIGPWLGPDAAAADLPLPDLVAVELNSDATVDSVALALRLAEAAPEARLDDHRDWMERAERLSWLVRLLAMLVLGFVSAAAALAVLFVTRTGLDIHREVIELVHLLGAPDRYIARQFQTHALMQGFLGGVLGLAAGAATITAIGWLAATLGGGLVPLARLGWIDWAIIASLPVAAALVAMLTARIAVLHFLGRSL
ncbi:cell division protein [Hypericibacter terrae]|uniref:Cell division protein n=2 Tax=Hypericibacter TaxID=2705399 RepID=A0A5J6MRP8_9PROT|nr:FtsX-like permease family protein [Hypericibacter terrae]QEX19335.1 cell division protein [Hypericibacter terrae]